MLCCPFTHFRTLFEHFSRLFFFFFFASVRKSISSSFFLSLGGHSLTYLCKFLSWPVAAARTARAASARPADKKAGAQMSDVTLRIFFFATTAEILDRVKRSETEKKRLEFEIVKQIFGFDGGIEATLELSRSFTSFTEIQIHRKPSSDSPNPVSQNCFIPRHFLFGR